MMRKRWGVAGIVAAAIVTAALVPWRVPQDFLRANVLSGVEATSGLQADASGRATLSLLPRPRVKIDGLTIRSRDGGLVVESQSVKADIAVMPLLSGRVTITALAFITPTISYEIDRLSPVAVPVAALGAEQDGDVAPVTVSIVSGLARVGHSGNGFATLVDDINATLDWQGSQRPASLAASLTWRGEPFAIRAVANRPAEILTSERSPFVLQAKGRAGRIDLNGTAGLAEGPAYRGRFEVASDEPARLIRILGWSRAANNMPASLSMTGTAVLLGTSLELAPLRVVAADSDFEGSAAIRLQGVAPRISATLASRVANLSALSALLPDATAADGGWSRTPLGGAQLDVGLDIRLSAARLLFGRMEFADAALFVLRADDRLDIDLAQARFYAGRVKARLSILPSEPGLDLRLNASVNDVDLGALPGGAIGRRVSGRLTGQTSVTAQGPSVDALAATLHGRMQFGLRRGELTGMDVEEALRRIARRPLSVTADFRNGRTAFDSADATLDIDRGVGDLREARLAGPGLRLDASGRITFNDRALDLRTMARQVNGAGEPEARGSGLQLGIQGGWDNPHVVFDTDSLIRRSSAAAPLFHDAP